MRILFDARTVRPCHTGVGSYAYNILKHLAALVAEVPADPDRVGAGHALYALFLRGNVPSKLARLKGLEVLEVTADYERHPAGEVWENSSLIALGRKLHIDLFHGPAFLIPWRRTPFRKVVTIHDLIAFLPAVRGSQAGRCPRNYPRLFQAYLRFVIRRSAKSADRIIADSSNTREDLVALLPMYREKINVVRCGVGEPFRRLSESERERARQELNLPEKYILYVSNFEPRKNHSLLLRAFELLKRRFSLPARAGVPHYLILVGKAGRGASLFSKWDRDRAGGQVLTVDYLPPERLSVYYNCADLFVFPSLYEGFGLPILEAFACGAPVLALSTSSIPEVAGDAAMLLPRETDAEHFAEAMLELISDEQKRQTLIQKGLARAASFTWDAPAERLFSIFTDLM
jgi:glycosyltransferase involved in cell wall biosynthesis